MGKRKIKRLLNIIIGFVILITIGFGITMIIRMLADMTPSYLVGLGIAVFVILIFIIFGLFKTKDLARKLR